MLTTAKLYFDIAVGIAVLLLIGFAGWQYDAARLARKDTAAALASMTQLQEGLAQLQRGQDASDSAIRGMSAALAASTRKATTVRQRVVTMGNENADVQKWLDARLPAGGCMLDDTCPGGTPVAPTVGGSASSVRPADADAVR